MDREVRKGPRPVCAHSGTGPCSPMMPVPVIQLTEEQENHHVANGDSENTSDQIYKEDDLNGRNSQSNLTVTTGARS